MSGELLRRAIERRGIKEKHVAQKKGINKVHCRASCLVSTR